MFEGLPSWSNAGRLVNHTFCPPIGDVFKAYSSVYMTAHYALFVLISGIAIVCLNVAICMRVARGSSKPVAKLRKDEATKEQERQKMVS